MASDIALEVIGDFAVVCLLSPKCSFKQRPKSGLSRAISGLPGHAFQVKMDNLRLRSFMHPVRTWMVMPHNNHRQSWNVTGFRGLVVHCVILLLSCSSIGASCAAADDSWLHCR